MFEPIKSEKQYGMYVREFRRLRAQLPTITRAKHHTKYKQKLLSLGAAISQYNYDKLKFAPLTLGKVLKQTLCRVLKRHQFAMLVDLLPDHMPSPFHRQCVKCEKRSNLFIANK